ncbi:hypothetical protein NDN08_002535 [Rhodosorus marinus]|uniref:RRM domain-containing protein n=1 Tax=Rhodosorus marinus TaxID=101924 RepID=A0AAV8UU01_9RHOD|nr:hypothetical protein NDN08_002535 [Rhodosorus marinus]
MSRLIVKGLPKHLTEERLKNHFSSAGEVTDARIRRTKDGRSRQFGFVGFRSSDEAKDAKRMFNNSFLDTNKLNIEIAHPYGDNRIPRGWSKYTKGTSGYSKLHPQDEVDGQEKTANEPGDENENRKKTTSDRKKSDNLEEFIAAAQPRSRKYVWSNDDSTNFVASEVKKTVKSKKRGGEGVALERTHVTFDEDESENDEVNHSEESGAEEKRKASNADADSSQEENVARDKGLTDLQYFKLKSGTIEDSDEETDGSRPSSDDGDDNEEDDAGSKDAHENALDDQPKTEEIPTSANPERASAESDDVEPLSESGRLFVRNLPYAATEEELEELFQKFGALAEVHLCVDATTKVSKGMAFVMYVIPEDAVRAVSELDGSVFMGRLLHILPARPKEKKEEAAGHAAGDEEGQGSSFKRDKLKKLKEAARTRSDVVAYNPLFMSGDAVAGALAERYMVDKAEILDDENAAVRLASGEAQLQEEVREVLVKEGVNVEAFSMMEKTSMKTKRSKSVILVKNLPAATTADQIRDKFLKFGSLGRVVVVPSGLIALVEYLEASDAKRGYSTLAYSRFREKPLYLEWAPLNAFKTELSSPATAGTEQREGRQQASRNVENEDRAPDESTKTIFVKNLNFSTTDEGLHRLFSKKNKIKSAKIAKRKTDSKSMGYGFVEFEDGSEAMIALKKMQGAALDGHLLELKLSRTGQRETGLAGTGSTRNIRTSAESAKSSKLLVKNLAFEASRKEVRQLFSSYGELKSVNLPQKFDGTSRGFAFVEFKSKSEAAAAMSALRATHFYARRLVIEYAEEEADVSTENEAAMAQRMNKEQLKSRPTKRRRTNTTAEDGGTMDGGDEADYEMYR